MSLKDSGAAGHVEKAPKARWDEQTRRVLPEILIISLWGMETRTQWCGQERRKWRQKGLMKKKKERSKLRKLLGLMIVLPAADMGSAFCFTCSTLIVTSLHSCCHRNQEQRQNKTAVKSWAQTREADPYTHFKSYFVNGRSILRQKQQEGRGEGRVVRNKSSPW